MTTPEFFSQYGPAVFAALAFLAVYVFAVTLMRNSRSASSNRKIGNLLADYGGVRGAGEAADVNRALKNSLLGNASKGYRQKMEQQLFAAGLNLPARTWGLITAGIALAVFVVFNILFESPLVALILAVAIAAIVPSQWLKARANKRGLKFAAELPQVLQVLASGLRSGLSFMQALEVIAAQDKGEVGVQFRQALAEVEYGAGLEESLMRVADRMKSVDLRWLVSALDIQREIGGALSGIFDNVAETIRGRGEVQREVQVLSAEGRLSAYVLLALPVVILLALSVIQPKYVTFFWTEPMGFVLLGVFVVLVTVGWFWLKKLVKVEV